MAVTQFDWCHLALGLKPAENYMKVNYFIFYISEGVEQDVVGMYILD